MTIERIISGGQSGADRAGRDAALACGILTGGWVPHGRKTENGPLSTEEMRRYGLQEHPSRGYPARTEQNVRWADATLIFGDPTSSGSQLTIRLCRMHSKPYLSVGKGDEILIRGWLNTQHVRVLNVAGNRESVNPGIYQITLTTLIKALS